MNFFLFMFIHSQAKHNALVLFVSMFYAFYGFGLVFVVCELGERLTNAFEQIEYEIEKSDWYLFSHEIQRLLPIILIVSQQPVELECFGSVNGRRETYKKVSHLSFDSLKFCGILCVLN